MNATTELTTNLDASEAIRYEANDTITVVERLMEQWQGRHSLDEQKQAWLNVGDLSNRRLSSSMAVWLIKAHNRGEVVVPITALYHASKNFNNEAAQLYLQKAIEEIDHIEDKNWRTSVEHILANIREWSSPKTSNIEPQTVALLEEFRKTTAEHNLAWSEEIFTKFSKRVRDQLYQNEDDLLNQKKITTAMSKHFSRPYGNGRLTDEKSVTVFFKNIAHYTFEQQSKTDGILYKTIKELLHQSDSGCLKICVKQLKNNGWSDQLIYEQLHQGTLKKKCAELDHMYIDEVARLANKQQQKQIFTYVVSGIANNIYRHISGASPLLKIVKNVLQKNYAQPSIGAIEMSDLRGYTDHVMKIWQNDPKWTKKCDGDRYAMIGMTKKSSAEFLECMTPRFAQADTIEAIELLKSIKQPSLHGLLDFWGKMHDVDYNITNKNLTLPQYYHPAGDVDKLMWERAQYIAVAINSENTKKLTRSAPKKM